MNLADLREKRNKLRHDMIAVQAAGDFTTESRAKFDALTADYDVTCEDILRAERTAKLEDEQRSHAQQNRPNPGGVEERSVLEKRAFADYIRTGAVPEQRDLLTINANGQALIPQAYAPEIVQAQKAWGGLVNIVKPWETESGAPMKTSLVNDTANLMLPVTEGTAGTAVDPAAASILISTDELQSVVKVSLAELQDASFNVESFIRDAFGPRYFRGLSSLMTAGSTSGNIQSIVTGNTNSITTAASGVLAYADLVSAYGKLDPAYIPTSTWTMNSSTRASLMGVVDGFGRPLFIPSPNAGAFDTLLGRPVVINQYQANVAASAVAVQFGDFSAGYKLRTVKPGLVVVRLAERYMDTLEVGFVAYSRNGGAITDAGTHPLVNVTIHA